MIDEENERQIQVAQKDYLEFLDDEEGEGRYHGKVKDMIEERRIRLNVNLNDLRSSKPERAEKLLGCSSLEQVAFKNALKQYVNTVSPSHEVEEFHVGFEGSFGHRHVSPRTLSSRFLNNMVCLEGIVTQTSLPKIKLVRSVHYCPATGKMHERQYADLSSLSSQVTSSTYPSKDPEGNILETEFGLSRYKDHQTVVVQEMPERAPAGQLPRSVDVICDDDLCDKVKPGDRVQIIGLYRCLPAKNGSFTNGVFRTVLIANNIKHLSKEFTKVFHRMDVRNCRKMSQKSNIFDLLAHSLAPSIQGHDMVKKAILCMLLGGVEKVLPTGTRLRGDINILLVGDPSVAKSQLLRFVLCTAPRAIATTGRGSSGVGLTAAVTHDKETGERKLEAGAMVLADRGVVCIDEFDKMTDMDRTAIHEVMEQGRVTIAKAGIHARLNARCSVLAAANPVWGRYNRFKPPMENINLQASLLSRFDLLFVLLDDVDNERDSLISDHVVRMHRYRNPGEPDGTVLPMSLGVEFLTTGIVEETTSDAPVPVYEKYDPLLHGNLRKQSDRIFSQKFMRVYVELAKSSIKPVLTDEAIEAITEEYTRLRSHDPGEDGFAQTQPITVRTLETLIRLATAHAKARLSCEINLDDAKAAIELVQYALFKKVIEDSRKRRHSSDRDSGDDDDDDDEGSHQRKRRPDPFEYDSQDKGPTSLFSQELAAAPAPSAPTPADETLDGTCLLNTDETVDINAISAERFETFKKLASKVFQQGNKSVISVKEFINAIQEGVKDCPFSKPEMEAAVAKMTEENHIMVANDKVYII